MIKALNEDFSKLTLAPAFKAPKFRKDYFHIHAFAVVDQAHILDEDLQRMTGSSKSTTVKILDVRFAFIETEIRVLLKPLSALVSLTRAMEQDLSEINLNRLDHFQTVVDGYPQAGAPWHSPVGTLSSNVVSIVSQFIIQ